MKQHIHHLHVTLKKTLYILSRKQLFISLIVGATMISASAFVYNSFFDNSLVHHAELNFTERSQNPNILGSVVPASCESYPTVGQTHGIDNYGGHCTGTCPSGYTINARPYYRECVYHLSISGDGGSDSYSYVETYASESCPATHPTTGYPLEINDVITVPLCSKQCDNGSWSFPHVGINCPASPPSVHLEFQ